MHHAFLLACARWPAFLRSRMLHIFVWPPLVDGHRCVDLFVSVIWAAGFSPSTHGPALCIHLSPRGCTLLLIMGDNVEHISHVKKQIIWVLSVIS